MGKPLRILLVAAADSDAEPVLEELRRGGYEPMVERVNTAAAMRQALEQQSWDVILSEYAMPHFSAPSALALLKESDVDLPFILVSGAVSDDVAMAALNAGAHDYVRPGDLARLGPALARELRAADVRAARRQAEIALHRTEAKYRSLVDQIPAGLHLIALDADNSTLSVSPQIERMLGFSQSEWMADPNLWRKQLHPEDRERVLAEISHLYAPGAQPFVSEYRLLARDGHTVWLRDETVIVRDAAGQPQYLQSVKLDISERKRMEAEVQEINKNLSGWVNELEQQNREITLLNAMTNQLQNCLTIEEAFTTIADFGQMLFPAESGVLYMLSDSRSSLEAATAWGRPFAGEQVFAPDECWALRRGRVHFVEDLRVGPVCPHLGESAATGYLCVPMVAQGETLGMLHLQRGSLWANHPDAPREPLTESKERLAIQVAEQIAQAMANLKLRETLRIQSNRDSLTGLFNRRYVEEILERELRRSLRKERPLGVIVIDLDNFRSFNTRHGHEAADTLLRGLSSFLQEHIREEDLAGRYSGEEFIIVLPETTAEVARERAEKLREEFMNVTLEHRGAPLQGVTLSVGVAGFPQDGTTLQALLRAADAGLDHARPAAPPGERSEAAAAAPEAAEHPGAADNGEPAAPRPPEAPQRVVVGDLSLNCQTFELTVQEKVVRPTPVEFELLQFLMSHAGNVYTAEQLLREVWHYPPDTGSQELVRAHIKNLRSKIEPNPRRPVYIKTIGRFGYTVPKDGAPN